MKKRIASMVYPILAVALLCLHVAALDAEAARFGGGKSFGSKPSYSRSTSAPHTTQQQQGAYANRQTQTQSPMAASPSRASGFRGMMGGLLAGTLLGSLLFGDAHAGFGIMDMAMFALAAFMVLKLLRFFTSRRTAEDSVGGNARMANQDIPHANPWQGIQGAGSSASTAQETDIRLAEFDQENFLRGAKMLYVRLQESWDKRDLDDIATFTTQAILREVKAQAEAEPKPSSQTEIMLVNASLVSAVRDGDEDVATVFFDVLLRENPDAQTPGQVRELWHFVRPSGSNQSWRLDGIQQVA